MLFLFVSEISRMYHAIAIETRDSLKDPWMVESMIMTLTEHNYTLFVTETVKSVVWWITHDFPTYTYTQGVDLFVVFGGDGTLLHAVMNMQDYSIPVIGVNLWHVWFLTTLTVEQFAPQIEWLLHGAGQLDERMMLDVTVTRGGDSVYQAYALNEAQIFGAGVGRLVYVDAMMGGDHLCTYAWDWLLISTATWSTAYNLSAWWPILCPGMHAMILTPVASHSFSQKPVVLGTDAQLELSIDRNDSSVVTQLSCDGKPPFVLQHGDTIAIKEADDKLKLLWPQWTSFFATIREKLDWGKYHR